MSQASITLRAATPADYPIIRQLAHDTWPTAFGNILRPEQISYMLELMYSVPSIADQVNRRGHRFLVADLEGEDVGYVSYEIDYETQGKTKIHKLYVLPSTQGKGVGRYLIDEVARLAREQGQSWLELDVNRYNPSIEFYKRIGFAIVGEKDTDIGEGFLMEDVVMRKTVDGNKVGSGKAEVGSD